MRSTAAVRKPLGVRATPDQLRLLREAAAREHRSLSSFVLTAALKAAETPVVQPRKTKEEILAIFAGVREEFETLHPGRDPLAEFLAERREEAACE